MGVFPVMYKRHLLVHTNKQSCARNRPWRPIGLSDAEDPILSRQLLKDCGRLSVLHSGQALLSPGISFFIFQYSFLLDAE
jgi:hypothetical protein